jgi:magnesium-transporting ATPase (P-type)
MDKGKNYFIGFLIVFTFEWCMELGFIIRLIIGFTRPINVFTFGLIIPLALLAVILIFDSIFLSHWVKEIKRHDGRVKKHTEALLVVKSNTKRGIYNTDIFFQWASCVFLTLIFIGIVPLVLMVSGWNGFKSELGQTKCKNDYDGLIIPSKL